MITDDQLPPSARHINSRFHLSRNQYKENKFKILKIPTQEKLADILKATGQETISRATSRHGHEDFERSAESVRLMMFFNFFFH